MCELLCVWRELLLRLHVAEGEALQCMYVCLCVSVCLHASAGGQMDWKRDTAASTTSTVTEHVVQTGLLITHESTKNIIITGKLKNSMDCTSSLLHLFPMTNIQPFPSLLGHSWWEWFLNAQTKPGGRVNSGLICIEHPVKLESVQMLPPPNTPTADWVVLIILITTAWVLMLCRLKCSSQKRCINNRACLSTFTLCVMQTAAFTTANGRSTLSSLHTVQQLQRNYEPSK